MEFQKLIEERRSIRKYDPSKKVTEETVKEIIEAALQAPSWKNQQTSRYYCVLSEDMKNSVITHGLPEFNQQRAKGAAALIVTAFVSDCVGFDDNKMPVNEIGNGWGCYDLGLQNQNFILKARELGLDTLIMGIRDGDKIAQVLDIPVTETVVSVIALGYAAEEKRPDKPKRKSPEEIARFYI